MAHSNKSQHEEGSAPPVTSGASGLDLQACAKAIRGAVRSLVATGDDVPLTLRLSDYRACLDANELRAMGIGVSDSVMEVLSRVPHIAASWVTVLIRTTLEALGIEDHTAEIDHETEALICRIAADIIISAAGVQEQQQAMGCVHVGLKQSGDWWAMYVKVSQLASEKIEGQRWVVDGVYDRTIPGPRERLILIEEWGIDLLIRGLSGEQRHKIIEEKRSGEADAEILYRCTFLGTYDPINREPYWQKRGGFEAVKELDWRLVGRLAHHVLSLSGFGAEPEGDFRRGTTDRKDVGALLDLTLVSRHATSDTHELLNDIASHFIHEHQWGETGWRTWEGDGRPQSTLYGYLGKALKLKLLDWQTKGILEGDDASLREWLVLPGKPEMLDYLRERKLPRGSGKPTMDAYEGGCLDDAESGFEWNSKDAYDSQGVPRPLTGSPQFTQIDTEDFQATQFREIERIEGTAGLVLGESVTEGDESVQLDPEATEWMGGAIPECFEEQIMVEHDVGRAFEATYHLERSSSPSPPHPADSCYPVLASERRSSSAESGIECALLNHSALRSPTWSGRTTVLSGTAKRDHAVFCARHFWGLDRCDIASACGIPEREAHTAWRQIESKRKGAKIRDWLISQGYGRRAGLILPIDVIRRLLARSGRACVSGSAPNEYGRLVLARTRLGNAIEHLQKECLHVLTRPGGCSVPITKNPADFWDDYRRGRLNGVFTRRSGWWPVRRIDYRPFHSPAGNFALSWQKYGEWRPDAPSASTISGLAARRPTLPFSHEWAKWRAELHADHPEVSEEFKSDDFWWPRSMFTVRSVECTFDHGVGEGLKLSARRSLKHSDGTPIKRGNHLLVTDRVLTELRLRRQLGVGSQGNLRSYDAWNDKTPGEGAYWWVLGGAHSGLDIEEDLPERRVRTTSVSFVYPKLRKIRCYSCFDKCKHTVFWPTPFGDIRETALANRTVILPQPEWEYELHPVRGIFTGVVMSEASWGPCKPPIVAGFQMWITHSRDDLSVGATLNGKPIIEKTRVSPDLYEYHLRVKPANLGRAWGGTIPKLPVFLDDDPAKWSERFARLPELETAARLQQIRSFRNACHIFQGPVYVHGGARVKKCKCKDGQMCMVFRCSQCGGGAEPLHWNVETAKGHCSACCPTRLTVSSGGTLHGPLDGSARLVSGSLNQLITLWEGRSRRFLPGDAAPGWAQCLVLGSGLPAYPELLAYRAIRAAHVQDLQDKEKGESIKED